MGIMIVGQLPARYLELTSTPQPQFLIKAPTQIAESLHLPSN